ncbi:competence type IV pilus major pilin ComGC [Lapidilactobacillus mulanensis]|uniref:Competence type IV pilus major pilin ComGC n=1 Tax=Lapidilactobacillus mulanensis TaxID=2485999 RepID=A0ABW4DPR8_9LACO|nr:competence type IV pilus major pilin ComGC [Lapidilactobacillus mulanensis]
MKKLFKTNKKRAAFTLIEMSLVLLIISLLLIVILPNLNQQKNSADEKVNSAFAKNVETQVMLYQGANDKVPSVAELVSAEYITKEQETKIDKIGLTIDQKNGKVSFNESHK